MMSYSDELKQLDEILKRLSVGGSVKNITVETPNGYLVEITDEKFREVAKGGHNPITLIVNATANATATSSLTASQKIQKIIHSLEESNVGSKKLSDAKRRINTLEIELDKPNPSEKVIKKVMRWASDFGLELFLRLAVLVAERFLKPT